MYTYAILPVNSESSIKMDFANIKEAKIYADSLGENTIVFLYGKSRTTYDEFQIHSNYGQGWEETCADTTRQAAKQTLKEYRENQPQYSHKIVVKRVKIAA